LKLFFIYPHFSKLREKVNYDLLAVNRHRYFSLKSLMMSGLSMSYQYLVGAEIDYKDDINGSQFVIKNPNATTTCGCGSSFSA
jgi:iron-sulfur cluster assembly accessory protein